MLLSMIWIVAAVSGLLLFAVDVWTLRTVWNRATPRPWRVAAVAALVTGVGLGFWIGCSYTYHVTSNLQYIGFPIPVIALQLEDGHWVDYVSFLPITVPFNVFVVVSSCLLPVTVGLLISRWITRRGSRSRGREGSQTCP